MKTFFRYTGAVLSLLVLAAVVGAVILYQKGVYDFSFAPRSYAVDPPADNTELDSQTLAPDTTIALEVDDNISGIFDPDSFGGNETQPIKETTAETTAPTTPAAAQTVYPTVASLKSSGYKCTSSNYSRNTHKLALVTGGVEINRALLSNGKYTLSAYMGYIIYNKGSSAYALGVNGVVSVAGIQNLTPAYLRDSAGHPLWISGDKYYYLVDNSNNMIEVIPDLNYSPSLRFDYPVGYGAPSETLKRYYAETEEPRKIDAEGNDVTDEVDHALSEAVKAGYDIEDPNVLAKLKLPEYTVEALPCIRWGYVNQYNQIVIPAQYYFASEFDSTGRAVVAGRYGIVNVINTYGSIAITLRSAVLYPEERNRRPVTEDYYLPDSFGIESIGMFAFDCGYMRMRYMQYDYKKETEIVQDYDVLVRPDGTLYNIPSDYTLEGYSEGVLLLKKDDCYGMLDTTGKWIAQPIYTYATPFIQGLAIVGFKGGKMAMIDISGNIVLPFDYDYISGPSSGVVVAHSSEGWSIFNIMSK